MLTRQSKGLFLLLSRSLSLPQGLLTQGATVSLRAPYAGALLFVLVYVIGNLWCSEQSDSLGLAPVVLSPAGSKQLPPMKYSCCSQTSVAAVSQSVRQTEVGL